MTATPHDHHSEQVIIGTCLQCGRDAISEVSAAWRNPVELFHDIRNREAWLRLQILVADDRDISAVEMMQVKHTEPLDAAYIGELDNAGIVQDLLPSYIQTALERLQAREAINIANELEKCAISNPDAIASGLSQACKSLFALEATSGESLSIDAIRKQVASEWETAFENKGVHSGIDSGLHVLDGLTWGFQNGELVIIGARPSQGKTALLCRIAINAIDSGTPTLFFSLESSAREIFKRLVCIRAGVDSTTLRNGTASQQELTRVVNHSIAISRNPIWIVDKSGLTIDQLQSIARRYVREHGVKLILGDYVQIVAASQKNEKRTYELGSISNGLKAMAKELNVPCVWAAQLNRDVEKAGEQPRRPRPSDLGDSKQIEQDADLIALLHRLPEQPNTDSIDYELIVAKHRNGGCGRIPLSYIPKFTRFDGGHVYEP